MTIHPAPKPPAREKKLRKPLKRTSSLSRSTPMPKGTKGLAKENPARQARVAKQRKKARQSPEELAARKAARERANGQCEFIIRPERWSVTRFAPFRCPETEGLQDHHKSHPKGIVITAEHFQVLCTPHHHYVETTQFGYRHTKGRRYAA